MTISIVANTPANLAAAQATPNAHVWVDGRRIVVYTSPDRPADKLTPEQIQANQDAADAVAAKAYAKLSALAAMTPAQVQAWVSANVTTLAQAQDAIATLAIAVSLLARKI